MQFVLATLNAFYTPKEHTHSLQYLTSRYTLWSSWGLFSFLSPQVAWGGSPNRSSALRIVSIIFNCKQWCISNALSQTRHLQAPTHSGPRWLSQLSSVAVWPDHSAATVHLRIILNYVRTFHAATKSCMDDYRIQYVDRFNCWFQLAVSQYCEWSANDRRSAQNRHGTKPPCFSSCAVKMFFWRRGADIAITLSRCMRVCVCVCIGVYISMIKRTALIAVSWNLPQ